MVQKNTYSLFFFLVCGLSLMVGGFASSCTSSGGKQTELRRLPILGQHHYRLKDEEGNAEAVYDTLYHQIGDFKLLNQDSNWVTAKDLEGKVYVADFFFTSCSTICPLMAKHMLKVYEAYKADPRVVILSHSIDPEYDDVSVLKTYAEGLQVSSDTWHFVTGDKAQIYDLATQYLSTVVEDSTQIDGLVHSGYFLLIDPMKRIRGVYDGTQEVAADSLLKDIEILLQEGSVLAKE